MAKYPWGDTELEQRVVHRVTNKDTVNRHGICSICGPVKLTTHGSCAEANRLHARQNHKKHRDQRVANMKTYYRNHKEEHKERNKVNYHVWKHGITQAEFDAVFEAQGCRCAICQTTTPTSRGWHLDHDHNYDPKDARGHRGILCSNCNAGLGMFQDTQSSLRRAADYLDYYKGAQC